MTATRLTRVTTLSSTQPTTLPAIHTTTSRRNKRVASIRTGCPCSNSWSLIPLSKLMTPTRICRFNSATSTQDSSRRRERGTAKTWILTATSSLFSSYASCLTGLIRRRSRRATLRPSFKRSLTRLPIRLTTNQSSSEAASFSIVMEGIKKAKSTKPNSPTGTATLLSR